jgi:hypothetical protein
MVLTVFPILENGALLAPIPIDMREQSLPADTPSSLRFSESHLIVSGTYGSKSFKLDIVDDTMTLSRDPAFECQNSPPEFSDGIVVVRIPESLQADIVTRRGGQEYQVQFWSATWCENVRDHSATLYDNLLSCPVEVNGVTLSVFVPNGHSGFSVTKFSLLDGTHICDEDIPLKFDAVVYDAFHHCHWVVGRTSDDQFEVKAYVADGAIDPFAYGFGVAESWAPESAIGRMTSHLLSSVSQVVPEHLVATPEVLSTIVDAIKRAPIDRLVLQIFILILGINAASETARDIHLTVSEILKLSHITPFRAFLMSRFMNVLDPSALPSIDISEVTESDSIALTCLIFSQMRSSVGYSRPFDLTVGRGVTPPESMMPLLILHQRYLLASTVDCETLDSSFSAEKSAFMVYVSRASAYLDAECTVKGLESVLETPGCLLFENFICLCRDYGECPAIAWVSFNVLSNFLRKLQDCLPSDDEPLVCDESSAEFFALLGSVLGISVMSACGSRTLTNLEMEHRWTPRYDNGTDHLGDFEGTLYAITEKYRQEIEPGINEEMREFDHMLAQAIARHLDPRSSLEITISELHRVQSIVSYETLEQYREKCRLLLRLDRRNCSSARPIVELILSDRPATDFGSIAKKPQPYRAWSAFHFMEDLLSGRFPQSFSTFFAYTLASPRSFDGIASSLSVAAGEGSSVRCKWIDSVCSRFCRSHRRDPFLCLFLDQVFKSGIAPPRVLSDSFGGIDWFRTPLAFALTYRSKDCSFSEPLNGSSPQSSWFLAAECVTYSPTTYHQSVALLFDLPGELVCYACRVIANAWNSPLLSAEERDNDIRLVFSRIGECFTQGTGFVRAGEVLTALIHRLPISAVISQITRDSEDQAVSSGAWASLGARVETRALQTVPAVTILYEGDEPMGISFLDHRDLVGCPSPHGLARTQLPPFGQDHVTQPSHALDSCDRGFLLSAFGLILQSRYSFCSWLYLSVLADQLRLPEFAAMIPLTRATEIIMVLSRDLNPFDRIERSVSGLGRELETCTAFEREKWWVFDLPNARQGFVSSVISGQTTLTIPANSPQNFTGKFGVVADAGDFLIPVQLFEAPMEGARDGRATLRVDLGRRVLSLDSREWPAPKNTPLRVLLVVDMISLDSISLQGDFASPRAVLPLFQGVVPTNNKLLLSYPAVRDLVPLLLSADPNCLRQFRRHARTAVVMPRPPYIPHPRFREWCLARYSAQQFGGWATVVVARILLNHPSMRLDWGILVRLFSIVAVSLERFDTDRFRNGLFPFALNELPNSTSCRSLNHGLHHDALAVLDLIAKRSGFIEALETFLTGLFSAEATHFLNHSNPKAIPVRAKLSIPGADYMIISGPNFSQSNLLPILHQGDTFQWSDHSIDAFALAISVDDNVWVYGTCFQVVILLKHCLHLHPESLFVRRMIIDMVLIQSPFVAPFLPDLVDFACYGATSKMPDDYLIRLVTVKAFAASCNDARLAVALGSLLEQECFALRYPRLMGLSSLFPEFLRGIPSSCDSRCGLVHIPRFGDLLQVKFPHITLIACKAILCRRESLWGFPFAEVLPAWLAISRQFAPPEKEVLRDEQQLVVKNPLRFLLAINVTKYPRTATFYYVRSGEPFPIKTGARLSDPHVIIGVKGCPISDVEVEVKIVENPEKDFHIYPSPELHDGFLADINVIQENWTLEYTREVLVLPWNEFVQKPGLALEALRRQMRIGDEFSDRALFLAVYYCCLARVLRDNHDVAISPDWFPPARLRQLSAG